MNDYWKACSHPNPEHGEFNDYCPDCGATKSRIRKGADWHICEHCALPSRVEKVKETKG